MCLVIWPHQSVTRFLGILPFTADDSVARALHVLAANV